MSGPDIPASAIPPVVDERRHEARRLEDRSLFPSLGSISNEQIFVAIARLEVRADAAATAQQNGLAALNQRIEDKFSGVQQHLERQDARLHNIDQRLTVAHDNALVALQGAKRAGAASGAGMAAVIQGGLELMKFLLKP